MQSESPRVLTIGGFDGVHLGHQQIVARLRQVAEELNCRATLVTFEPHPAQFLHPEFPYLLTPLSEKLSLLTELGVDEVVVLRFDAKLRDVEPEEFVKRYLVSELSPVAVVIGADHRFGKGARGGLQLLVRILGEYQVRVEVVPEVVHLGAPVRATRVREHLLLGHIRLADELLGRAYAVSGRVVPGLGIGRRLGFPTINLEVVYPDKLLPPEGVYAVTAEISARIFPGVANIGFRPTFSERPRGLEVHLFDFSDDVPTGERLTVRFYEYLRPEQRFPDARSLGEQIKRDAERARQYFESGAR